MHIGTQKTDVFWISTAFLTIHSMYQKKVSILSNWVFEVLDWSGYFSIWVSILSSYSWVILNTHFFIWVPRYEGTILKTRTAFEALTKNKPKSWLSMFLCFARLLCWLPGSLKHFRTVSFADIMSLLSFELFGDELLFELNDLDDDALVCGMDE